MDKVYHLIAGLIISVVVGLIAYFGLGLSQPEAYGWGASLLAGAGKGTFDTIKAYMAGTKITLNTLPKIFDFFDFMATGMAGLLGLVIVKAIAGTL